MILCNEIWKILRLSGFHCFLKICKAVFKHFIWNLQFVLFPFPFSLSTSLPQRADVITEPWFSFRFWLLRFKRSSGIQNLWAGSIKQTKSGKSDSRDRDKHTLLKVFVKSSQKWEEKERVSCTVGVMLELSWEKGNVNNTGIWSESRVSKTWV